MSLRIALIGCGRWGARILSDLALLDADVWVVDPAASVASGPAVAGRLDSIDGLPDVDGAIVATPASTHARVAEQALELGVPVFVEKPLATDPADAARLARLGEDRLRVMDKWRYHPAIQALAGIARTNELGPVQSIHSRRVKWAHAHDDVDTVWTQMPHDLSITDEILGWLPPARFARAEHAMGQRVGMIAALGAPPWVHIEVSCVAPAHRRELRVLFADGVAHFDSAHDHRISVGRDWRGTSDELEHRPVSATPPLRLELEAFLAFLGGGPPPKSEARRGAEIVVRLSELGELSEQRGAEVSSGGRRAVSHA